MKIKLLTLAALLAASNVTWGLVIDDTDAGANNGADVGLIDLFIGVQEPPPGTGDPAGEEAWAESLLPGVDLDFTSKIETVGIFDTDAPGVRASLLPAPPLPSYFIVKNATYRALFENVDDLAWGVIDTSVLPSDMNLDGATVSHITGLIDDSGPDPDPGIPEPGVLALFGIGLLGIGVSRRRTTKTRR